MKEILDNRMENARESMIFQNEQMEKHKAAGKVGKSYRLTEFLKIGKRQHRQHNPILPNMADYLQWVIYDRAAVAAAGSWPTSTSLYTSPIGQNSKTKADTNLDQVSLLPNPYWMNVTHIGLYPDPNVLLLDWIALCNQSYFEFWVNNRVQFEGKLQHAPGGNGPNGNSTKTAESAYNNGYPVMSNMMDLRLPGGIGLGMDPSTGNPLVSNGVTGITILQGQQFKVQIILPGGALTLTSGTATPNIGTGLTLNCELFGQLSRSL